MADLLPPGQVLAGLAGDLWDAGLDRRTDDELIGVMGAARRLESWAGAMKLAAIRDLWRRRAGEQEAGDTGAAEHADSEIAAALTLTGYAANQVLDLAIALDRLPLTAAALAAGDIDLPRARVITNELSGLGDEHAAAVEAAIIGAAPGQTTGQLGQAARRAVITVDPAAARKRKEQALREARVERWTEHAGTAALAGRDLPPLSVLEADQNLTALAQQLKDAGCEGTMDTLRAQVYLALLSGTAASSLLPAPGRPDGAPLPAPGRPDSAPLPAPGRPDSAPPPTHGQPTSADSKPGAGSVSVAGNGHGSEVFGHGRNGSGNSPKDEASGSGNSPQGSATSSAVGQPYVTGGADAPAGPASRQAPGHPGATPATGSVNLTMPLAAWLGLAEAPGHATGFGPLDAADSRTLADALAARPGTKWCLTLTDSDGHPIAHGCARTGPPAGRHRAPPATGPPATGPPGKPGPAIQPPIPPGTGQPSGSLSRRAAQGRAGPSGAAGAWTVTLTWLGGGDCDHARQTPGYVPSPTLRHLVQVRQPTCSFPGCRRPAIRTDLDHTVPFDHGGRTCLCNLGPLCRHHHQVKQAPGWALEQVSLGVMTWTTPSGRRYTVRQQSPA